VRTIEPAGILVGSCFFVPQRPNETPGDAAMLDGPAVVAALEGCGVTHVVWIPDSEIGQWGPALAGASGLQLIRVCREGEAIAVAAGLHLGGARPVVVIQCTGLFEAGDTLRNILYDLRLPLFFLIGVRSYHAHQKKATTDSCPVFTEPILKAWQVPYVVFDHGQSGADLAAVYQEARTRGQALAVLLAE
jgi:sulfopyruvate decarboxylase TPP-binding subunit